MDVDSKKSEERRIFDLVYSDRSLNDVQPHENPDFLVRLSPGLPYFGVEVTEYHVNETSARIDRIEGYSTALIDGGDFRHKDDVKHVEVAKVDIIKPDDSIFVKDVPMIIQKVPPPATCARGVSDRIVAKGRRVGGSDADVYHTNLIIEDRTDVLRTVRSDDFYRIYFVPELIDSIRASLFREVFLVTTLAGEEVYIRLKMLHLLAEAYLFAGALENTGVDIPAPIHGSELFAAYFNGVTKAPVLIHRQDLGVEVIFGDSGVIFKDDDTVTVRLHSDFPMSPGAVEPTVQWESVLGTGFLKIMSEYRDTHTFSTSAICPVHKKNRAQ